MYVFPLLCDTDNHDLGVTDTLPSVYASKAMVHCICTCDIQLSHVILFFLITDRLIASYEEIF